MAEYDYSLLLGRIKSEGFTQERLAKTVGIGATSMNHALNSKREFRQNEIQSVCSELHIAREDIPTYFFTYKLLKPEVDCEVQQ